MTQLKRFGMAWLIVLVMLTIGFCQNPEDFSINGNNDSPFVNLQPSNENRVSKLGTTLSVEPELSTPEYYHSIATQAYNPKVWRARNNVYYAVTKVDDNANQLKIYKNTGDPGNSDWVYVATLANASYNLEDADILALYNINRIYVVYTVNGSYVEVFGCRMNDPSISRFETIASGSNLTCCSMISSEYNFPSNPWLFVSWKEGSSAKASASYNWGSNWYGSTVASSGVAQMYTGNAIEWCSDSMIVCVYYKNTSGDGIVGRSWANFAAYQFSLRTALTDIDSVGGIACYSNVALVCGTRGSLTTSNIVYAYSTTNGWNWSNAIEWDESNGQLQPSVATNHYGYFGILYCWYDPSAESHTMIAKRNYYNYLGNAWTTEATNAQGKAAYLNSACLGDGALPQYGGAYNGETTGSPTWSAYCWAGSVTTDAEVNSGKSPEMKSDLVELSTNLSESADINLDSKPNPFNNSTMIRYNLQEGNHVRLAVYDLTGRTIEVLTEGYQQAGQHEVKFAPTSLAGGVYLIRLESGQLVQTKKMIYLK